MNGRVATQSGAFVVAPFEPAAADCVADWVADEAEFQFLSPETEPPVTGAKVIAWGAPTHRQWLFRHAPDTAAFGYGELNDMPNQPNQKWIGHLLLAPAARGRSFGVRCVRRLVCMAFDALDADQVLLVVVPANQRAVRCYARAGLEYLGEEWKRRPRLSLPYRLLRMGITHEKFVRTRAQFAELDA